MKKLLDETSEENLVVHVIFCREGEEYECVGVLTKEEKTMIRVSFNAINDIVKDYIELERGEIISIEVVNASKITVL